MQGGISAGVHGDGCCARSTQFQLARCLQPWLFYIGVDYGGFHPLIHLVDNQRTKPPVIPHQYEITYLLLLSIYGESNGREKGGE